GEKVMKRVFNLLVVDESGSMSIIKRHALVGINETLTTIQKMQETHKNLEQRVTLITFDSTHTNVFYDNVRASNANPLKAKDYNPCGATPLYDAIGMGIAKINALTTEDDNVLVTIITDGEENCSEEYSLKMIKNLIEKLKKQNWTFTFIGTDDLDVENIAMDMGIDNHLQFSEDEAGTKKMFARENRARERYNKCRAMDCKMEAGSYFEEE
uniref:vWA domain-containing protein n=3 Tax=Segatella hominis TaxID=2518605 RepID=UPI003AB58DE0